MASENISSYLVLCQSPEVVSLTSIAEEGPGLKPPIRLCSLGRGEGSQPLTCQLHTIDEVAPALGWNFQDDRELLQRGYRPTCPVPKFATEPARILMGDELVVKLPGLTMPLYRD